VAIEARTVVGDATSSSRKPALWSKTIDREVDRWVGRKETRGVLGLSSRREGRKEGGKEGRAGASSSRSAGWLLRERAVGVE